ncbi:DUF2975 domain-containing protein [Cytobacillus sp. FJAT-53684]|uniref:DUF2975 domain-containing protein n=1 Tax=Cytobacillus mangrovibacter TaxID=3299024 RepID=A0ABW6K368_9BACI
MKRGTTIFLKLAVFIIGLIILLLCIFWLPQMAGSAAELNPEFAYLKYPILIGLYFTVIPFYFALYQSLKLVSYIESRNTFSELATLSLKHIKRCALIIIFTYIIGIIFLLSQSALHPGIALIGVGIICAAFVVSRLAGFLQETF